MKHGLSYQTTSLHPAAHSSQYMLVMPKNCNRKKHKVCKPLLPPYQHLL